MKIIKQVPTTIHEVTDILCNKCGQSCYVGDDNCKQLEGALDITVTGGFCSQLIGDLSKHNFSLCEKCFMELANSFVIPSLKFSYANGHILNGELTRKVMQEDGEEREEYILIEMDKNEYVILHPTRFGYNYEEDFPPEKLDKMVGKNVRCFGDLHEGSNIFMITGIEELEPNEE